MAIDHRILQNIGVKDNASVLNMFENSLTANQNRRLAEEQGQRAQALAPFQQQAAEQQVVSNQQSIDANRDQRRLSAINQTGQRILPMLESGNVEGAKSFLINNIASLQKRRDAGEDIDITESTEALAKLQAGDIQGLASDINTISQIVARQGGVQNRVTSSKILENGTTVQSLSGGGTNVISPSGDVLTGSARTDALNKALGVKVQQKGDIAQAVSDVKIAETVALETESKEIAQNIESKRINIDETKFKNKERRNQVIDAKNARRKEADSGIAQIDSLLLNDRFTRAFGKVVTATPELLRDQESIDAIADVNQIKGLIVLESRQKLKGQGTITDSEQKILAQSSTVLDNPLISDERARKELRKIKRVFEDASDRNQLKRETKDRIETEAAQQLLDPSTEFAGFKVIR